MMRSSLFFPYQTKTARASTRTAQGATDFLRADGRIASLLPTVTRMAALQKDCAAILPDIFSDCTVLQFESDHLTLSIPNAALAAKLKQKLPNLKDALRKHDWNISAIRLKVQVIKNVEKPTFHKQLTLPAQAMSALAELGNSLEESPRNAALKAAIGSMIKRHRDTA
jgi:hypothetical protein